MKSNTLPCSCRSRRLLFAVAIVAVVSAAVVVHFALVERNKASGDGNNVPHNDEDTLTNGSEARHGRDATPNHAADDEAARDAGGSQPTPAPPSGDVASVVPNPLLSSVPTGLTAIEMNEWIDMTLQSAVLPQNYGGTLTAIFRDRSYGDLTRNFAVQHFDLYAGALARRGQFEPDSDEAKDIRAAFAEASRDTSTHIAGSALLGMERLSHIDPNIDRAALASLAASYAADAAVNLQTRIAAVQLCGTMHVSAALPTLRAVIADPAANTVLRMSAQRAIDTFSE